LDISVSGSNVYIAGYVNDGSSFYNLTPCFWINGKRHTLPVTAGFLGSAEAIAISDSNVYIAGGESDDGFNITPCFWLNGTKYTLPVTAGFLGSAEAIALR
jgi:hypothetical protein